MKRFFMLLALIAVLVAVDCGNLNNLSMEPGATVNQLRMYFSKQDEFFEIDYSLECDSTKIPYEWTFVICCDHEMLFYLESPNLNFTINDDGEFVSGDQICTGKYDLARVDHNDLEFTTYCCTVRVGHHHIFGYYGKTDGIFHPCHDVMVLAEETQ